ncbi:hypothetical protein CN941_09780 [Bacillus cereus]|nr:hypothetical protein CN941_09780 [Bacillus cereus]
MSDFKKGLIKTVAAIGTVILLPVGFLIVKDLPFVKNLTISEKEETATNSYELVKEQFKDYSK